MDNPEVGWDDAMQFRLTYEGPLYATQRDAEAGQRTKHSSNRHTLRMAFHKQLELLWAEYPSLSPAPTSDEFTFMTFRRPSAMQHAGPPRMKVDQVAERHQMYGFKFVPLVTAELELLCDLEILLLRPDKPGGVVWAGDLDNRLKTLLDALHIPDPGERYHERLGEAPEQIFCLLQDDKLITRVSVDSDSMLMPVSDPPSASDVRLVITVKLKPYRLNPHNVGFG